MTDNLDYFLWFLSVFSFFIAMMFGFKHRFNKLEPYLKNSPTIQFITKLVLIFMGGSTLLLLISGWLLVKNTVSSEYLRHLQAYKTTARNLASDLQKMEHYNLNPKLHPDDEQTLYLLDTLNDWRKNNPEIVLFYLVQKSPSGSNEIIFAPYKQQKTVRIENIPELKQSFLGQETIQAKPVLNNGIWTLSAFIPIYNTEGKINTVLGVVSDGYSLLVHIRTESLKVLGLLLIPYFLLYIIHWLIFTHRINEFKKTHHLVHHDGLTALPNRLFFNESLAHNLAGKHPHGQVLAVMFIDLDNFKQINDTFGHGTGDLLLKTVVQRMQSIITAPSLLARWGGDEFSLMLPQIKDEAEAYVIAQNLCSVFKQPFILEGHEMYVTISIGVSIYPTDGDTAEILLKNADTAMYKAKENGRNNVQIYSSNMNAKSLEKIQMINSLCKALDHQELFLHYQPQYDVATNKLFGAEALLRWPYPQDSHAFPADFIPLAEQAGLILPIEEWVLQQACKQLKSWQQAGLPAIKIAVNISARQFTQNGLTDLVKQILEETQLEPQYLELEITENISVQNTERVITCLHELKQLGVKVAIDDFGTGYSSLSYLKNLPIDSLKIDRSFIRNIPEDPDDTSIVTAIIALANNLKLDVVAEGVETSAQKDFLLAQNCAIMQGFLFSRPLSAGDFAKLLADSP